MIEFIEVESVELLDVEDDVYDVINYESLFGGSGVLDNEGHFIVNDIIVHNCIPDYVKRRDDTDETWKKDEHPEMAELLKDTSGILVFQEQLQAAWQKFAGFTAPEAEAARKAVAKKWTEKLKPIGEKWIAGASKILGREWAEKYWQRQQTFGRYAFNKCLAVGTILTDCITGECLPIEDAKGLYLNSSDGPDLVVDVHYNGCEPVYKITFTNGVSEYATKGHRYLSDDGYITVGQIIDSNRNYSFKYISKEVINVKEVDVRRRIDDSRLDTGGFNVPADTKQAGVYDNVGQYDNENQAEVRLKEVFYHEEQQSSKTRLSGRINPRGVLLDWALDGRWILVRPQSLNISTARDNGSRWSGKVCGILQCESSISSCQEASKIGLLKQEIGRQAESIGNNSEEIGERDNTRCAIRDGFYTGVHRWGWNNHDKWERLPNNWIRFEFGICYEGQVNNNGQCGGVARQQIGSEKEYCQYMVVTMDWLRAMYLSGPMDLSAFISHSYAEKIDRRIAIASMEYAGEVDVYSPEMLSNQHNYSIGDGHPIAANSHSTSYIMIAYLTAWLKVHFPSEWWAAVMSECHREKLTKYMNIARSEGVKFGAINVEAISPSFTVDALTSTVTPGLTSIKGIGESAVEKLKPVGKYNNIDDFVEQNGKSKTIIERLIKLGAFQRYHKNIKATWMWYQYAYCTGKEITELRKEVRAMLLGDKWTPEAIEEQRRLFINDFKMSFPKRKKIPPKILNWQPKADDSRENVMALYPNDYTLKERLKFEKEFLGYYWHSPMDLYHTEPGRSIKEAKESPDGDGVLEVVIEKFWKGKTKQMKDYARVTVSDGLNTATVIIWEDGLEQCANYIGREGLGIRFRVNYDPERDSFTVLNRTVPQLLETMAEYQARIDGEDGGDGESAESDLVALEEIDA